MFHYLMISKLYLVSCLNHFLIHHFNRKTSKFLYCALYLSATRNLIKLPDIYKYSDFSKSCEEYLSFIVYDNFKWCFSNMFLNTILNKLPSTILKQFQVLFQKKMFLTALFNQLLEVLFLINLPMLSRTIFKEVFQVYPVDSIVLRKIILLTSPPCDSSHIEIFKSFANLPCISCNIFFNKKNCF